MSRNSNSRATPQHKGVSMLAAVLIGMVLGLAIAGGIAWYILKTPSPFVNNVPHEQVKLEPDAVKLLPAAKPTPETASAVATAADAIPASGVSDTKPRFEFYKVLTDKSDTTTAAPAPVQPAAKPAGKADKKETYFMQAGAFASAEDADRLKAKLAMLGVEAGVQTATLPDNTVWYRVRLGPYSSLDEMNKVSAMLKQNGVTPTPMRTQ